MAFDGAVTAACSLLHDITMYAKDQGSAIYTCSLGAEKCFDRIWHGGLFYKLIDVFPDAHWMFLRNLYSSATAYVRWKDTPTSPFHPTRGTKQGILMSPLLFNVFIYELLSLLKEDKRGLHMGNLCINHMTYADDITLVAVQPSDFQALLIICTDYADAWRFSYGLKKTACMVIGRCPLQSPPTWFLKKEPIELCDTMTVLGVSIPASSKKHVANRISAANRSLFGLAESDSLYPGPVHRSQASHLEFYCPTISLVWA
jgi:hypothetical protein